MIGQILQCLTQDKPNVTLKKQREQIPICQLLDTEKLEQRLGNIAGVGKQTRFALASTSEFVHSCLIALSPRCQCILYITQLSCLPAGPRTFTHSGLQTRLLLVTAQDGIPHWEPVVVASCSSSGTSALLSDNPWRGSSPDMFLWRSTVLHILVKKKGPAHDLIIIIRTCAKRARIDTDSQSQVS